MNVARASGQRGEIIVRSTRRIPVRRRAAYWREAVSTVMPGLSVEYETDDPPLARLESRSFADATISRFVDNTATCHITHEPSRSRWREAYLLVLQCAGSGCYRQPDREATLVPGDLVLLDMSRRLELTFPKDHQELAWMLPQEALSPLLARPERTPEAISGRHGFGALLAGSMRTLAGKAGRHDPASEQALRLHLCNLAALTVGAALPVQEAEQETYRLVRRQQIVAYVEAHLHESDLMAERAASDLRMSRRWLHALFNEGGTTFAAWIARRRIEECRKLLDDPQYDSLSVTEIAFRHGFNDLSTFYRKFRVHNATTPLEVRRNRSSDTAVPP